MLQKQLSLVRVLFALALVVLWAVPAAQPVQGASITVNTFKDELNSNGNCSLREAIVAANTDRRVDRCTAGAGADTITLKAGTYHLTIAGLNEDAARTGDLDLTGGVKINGAGRTATFINANRIDRIFDVRPGVNAELRNLMVQNGDVGQANDHYGGGILNAGTLTLYKVRVTDNRTGELTYSNVQEEKGAGVYSTGTLTATHTYFDFNHNDDEGGGVSGSGKLTFVDARFADNNALYGGGLYVFGAGTVVTIDDSKFIRNECEEGFASAIQVEEGVRLTGTRIIFDQNGPCTGGTIMNDGETLLRYSTFLNNTSSSGLFFNDGAGSLKLYFSFLGDNNSPTLVQMEDGTGFIDRTTFSNNVGDVLAVRSGTLRMTNSTVSTLQFREHVDSGICAGAFCVSGGRLELVNVSARVGGSEVPPVLSAFGGAVFVHNTILADCRFQNTALTSGGYNIISNGDGCNWPAAPSDQVGAAAAPVDPLLKAFVSNGTYTSVLEPQPGSPAIDTADPAMCFRSDQRLTPRPQGPRCDIGAVEYSSSTPAAAPEYLSEEPAP